MESKTRGTWHLKYTDTDGKPRRKQIGTIHDYPTRVDAGEAAENLHKRLQQPATGIPAGSKILSESSNESVCPNDTARAWLAIRDWITMCSRNGARWRSLGSTSSRGTVAEVAAAIPKDASAHLRGLLHQLWDYAMFCSTFLWNVIRWNW